MLGRTVLAIALLAGPMVASGQELSFTPLVDLYLGTDSLAIDEPLQKPTVARAHDGHWFVAGLMLGHKWVEFDSEGNLIRAPGRRGEGPGEFRRINLVLPAQGDTIVLVEPSRLTRVLRDGTYVDRQTPPFRIDSWTRHAGVTWLTGRSSSGAYLWGLDPSGRVSVRYVLPAAMTLQYNVEVVSWGDDLWVWLGGRGPLGRVEIDMGRTVERWHPFERRDNRWRASVFSGPEGTLLVDLADFTSSPPVREFLLFDESKTIITRTKKPDFMIGGGFFYPGLAWGAILDSTPMALFVGLRIYELGLSTTQ